MQPHLSLSTLDTNASRSPRAISEASSDRLPAELHASPSLPPRSTSSHDLPPRSAPAALDLAPRPYLEAAAPSAVFPFTPSSDGEVETPSPVFVSQTASGEAWSLYSAAPALVCASPLPLDASAAPALPTSFPTLPGHPPPPAMSTFDYMFPAGVGHFSQAPQYDPVIQSTFSDYNSIPVPDLPHLDPSHPMTTEADPARFYARQLPISPAASLPSPHSSPQERDMMRQRRQLHQTRRLAKTRARNERTASGAYYANQAQGQAQAQVQARDVGLGINLSPEAVVSPPPSAQFSPGVPTLLEGYASDRASTASPPTYLEHHYGPPEQSPYDIPLGMSMPTSHPIYQPSPLPSMSNLSDVGTPEPRYRHSAHGTPTSSPGAPDQVRVLGSRPKPQCWDHGCNGRQFSTFSNLLRHQREKSGTSTKSYCPRCGAEFTRTTARNGHMAHEKCKSRRSS